MIAGRVTARRKTDNPLLAVLRDVEQNALRESLCEHAEDWKYGSAGRMAKGDAECRLILSDRLILSHWPVRTSTASVENSRAFRPLGIRKIGARWGQPPGNTSVRITASIAISRICRI